MKPGEYYELLNLLEELKGVEKMIKLHLDDDSDFMRLQYVAKKEQLISRFIDRLVSPPLLSAHSIHTIKMVIDRFYGDEMKKLDSKPANDDLSRLESAFA
jgi:hypothetical protein